MHLLSVITEETPRLRPGVVAVLWRAHPAGTDPGSMQVSSGPPPSRCLQLCEPLSATPQQQNGSGCGDHAGGQPCAAAVQPGEAPRAAGCPCIALTVAVYTFLTRWHGWPAEQKLHWQQGGGVPAAAGRGPAAGRGCVRRWVDSGRRCGQCVVRCLTRATAARPLLTPAHRVFACSAAAVAEIKSLGPDRWNDTYYPTAADAANVHKQWCAACRRLPPPSLPFSALLLCGGPVRHSHI